MPKGTVEDQPDRTIPLETPVRAVLKEVKDETVPYKDKQTGEAKSFTKWLWWFEVTDDRTGDGLYEGRKVRGETGDKLTNHPGNRARTWAEALLGRELPVGADIDTDEDLVGLGCVITVKHREYEKSGQTMVADEVDEVYPLEGYDDVPF